MNKLEKAMLELSAASRLPIEKVADKEIDENAQIRRARVSMAGVTGLHSFRVTRNVVARGPWVRRLFSAKPTGVKKVTEEKRLALAAEVEKLMRAEKTRQLELQRQLRVLLGK